jgi:hypothetical protein
MNESKGKKEERTANERGRGFKTSVVHCVPEIGTAVDSVMRRRRNQFLARTSTGRVSDCRILKLREGTPEVSRIL